MWLYHDLLGVLFYHPAGQRICPSEFQYGISESGRGNIASRMTLGEPWILDLPKPIQENKLAIRVPGRDLLPSLPCCEFLSISLISSYKDACFFIHILKCTCEHL